MKKILLSAIILVCSGFLFGQSIAGNVPKSAKEKLNEELSSPLFQSYNETVFDFVNENQHAEGYLNILEWLQGRVAGLELVRQKGELVPYIRGNKASLFLDEVSVDNNFFHGFPVSDIAMIKIIKGPFLGNIGRSSGGMIAIYTIRE